VADRPVAALIAGYGPSVPYNVLALALVAVWQSTKCYEGKRLWADLARIVSLGIVSLSVT